MFRYEYLMGLYADRFPGTLVLVYEEMAQDVPAFVEDLCKLLDEDVPAYENVVWNRRYGYGQARLARRLNPLWRSNRNPYGLLPTITLPRLGPWNARVIALTRWAENWQNDKDIMPQETAKAVMDFYRESNKKVSTKWNLDLERWGYF